MSKRRTIWDALADKVIEFIDLYDTSELRSTLKAARKAKKLGPKVVDTTATDVSDDGRTADPAPASNRSEPPSG